MPEISIIIPVYNGEKTISRCLKSVVNQKNFHVDYEIIVINDGSVDNTEKVVKNFVKRYKNIRYYSKNNGGVSSARNMGLAMACGKYISFVDCDDEIKNNYLSILEKNLGHDVVIFPFFMRVKNKNIPCRVNNNSSIEDMYVNQLINSACNKLYKKEICGRFCEKMAMGEDLLFNISILSKTTDLLYTDSVIYRYNINSGSAMTSYNRKYIYDYITLFKPMKKFCKSHNIGKKVFNNKYISCINHQLVMLSVSDNSNIKKEMQFIWNMLEKNNMLDIKTKNIRFLLFKFRCFDLLKISYRILYKIRDFLRQENLI